MTIKTKYSVGDDVWFNYEGRAKHGIIRIINVKVRDLISIEYEVKVGSSSYLITCKEVNLYPTMEKLMKKEKLMA